MAMSNGLNKLVRTVGVAGGLALAVFGLHRLNDQTPSFVGDWTDFNQQIYARFTNNLNENFGSKYSDYIHGLEALIDGIHTKKLKLDSSTQSDIQKMIRHVENIYNVELPAKIKIRADQFEGKLPLEFTKEETRKRLIQNIQLQDDLALYCHLLELQFKRNGVDYKINLKEPVSKFIENK